MNPSSINELFKSAKSLHEKKRKGSPDAFILSWIAWEGTKLRMLAIGQKVKGIKIKDTYSNHKDLRLWEDKKFNNQWQKVFGNLPSSMPGKATKIFRQLQGFKKYRDTIIHGKSLGNPTNIHEATKKLLEVLENKDWMKDINIISKSKKVNLLDRFEKSKSRN